MSKKLAHKCVKCGGPVIPGINGLLHGLSMSPDGHPSMGIKDTLQAIHYAEDCGKPDTKYHGPKLGFLETDGKPSNENI